MKKRVVLTITLALATALCGVACLNAGMETTMQEESVTQVERKSEPMSEESESVQEVVSNQIWLEEESIYLPDGAQITSQDEKGYEITWNDYNIRYGRDEKAFRKETQEDLGLGKLIPIVEETIKAYSGQDMANAEIEVHLVGEQGDMESGENVVLVVEYEENETPVDIIGYAYDINHYQVNVSFDKRDYAIMVESLTGEVLSYYYNNGNLGEYLHGWEAHFGEDSGEHELSEEEQKEFDELITSFVTKELGLGTVESIFAQYCGVAFMHEDDEYVGRAFYTATCKTEIGRLALVTVDIGERTITSFDTTMSWMEME